MFGNDLWLMIVFFIFGGVFMVVELIVPGFGVSGLAGIASIIFGVVIGASVLTPGQLTIVIILGFIFIVAMIVILYRSIMKNGRISKFLFLKDSAKKEHGYSSSENLTDMTGKEGIAETPLRPSGTAKFDSEIIDVVAEGKYIAKGTKIRIAKVEGFRILVEAVHDDNN